MHNHIYNECIHCSLFIYAHPNAIEFIIRSIERECIYYICNYAMNDRSISSPQFKRLVLPSLSGYRLVLRRSRRTKANGKAGPKLRGWVERSANC